jgi:hypothetical protein
MGIIGVGREVMNERTTAHNTDAPGHHMLLMPSSFNTSLLLMQDAYIHG